MHFMQKHSDCFSTTLHVKQFEEVKCFKSLIYITLHFSCLSNMEE